MTAISSIVIGILIILGSLLTLVTMIGFIRLPDVYTRSHAASKSATLGVMLVLIGCLLFFWVEEGYVSARLILGIVFVFITSPVAGHLISRAAYYDHVPLWNKTVRDDLKDKNKQAEKEKKKLVRSH